VGRLRFVIGTLRHVTNHWDGYRETGKPDEPGVRWGEYGGAIDSRFEGSARELEGLGDRCQRKADRDEAARHGPRLYRLSFSLLAEPSAGDGRRAVRQAWKSSAISR
jgi:hypothetical protein